VRPLIIVNPAAGGGRGRRLLPVVRELARARDASVEVVCTERPGHAVRLAQQATESGCGPIIAVGGDGTLHEVANGILHSGRRVPLVAVPAGTGNDFVRSLKLPRQARDALALAWDGAPQAIDVGACGDRFFLNAAGVGFDARVARAASSMPRALRWGTLPYVAAVLRELVQRRPVEVRYAPNGLRVMAPPGP
jgi:diacylglycerol kinase family enzyme